MEINIKLNKLFEEMYNNCINILDKNSDLLEKVPRSLVACAIVGENNKIYYGINIAWWHSVCAESVALGSAWIDNVRAPKYVMAVKKKSQTKEIVSLCPCGMCLQMFKETHPKIKIILKTNKDFNVYSLNDLMPLSK